MSLASGIRAGAAYVDLNAKDAGFIRSMKRGQRQLRSFASTASAAGKSLIAGGGSIVGVASVATKVFSKAGDQLDKMSIRTGFSAEALSELGFAAEQTGSDIETLEKGIKTMQRNIVDAERGLSTQTDALKAMGLSVQDLIDKSPEQQFEILAQAISEIEDPTRRAAAAAQFFGRAGVQLIPLMEGGAAGMKTLREEAKALGLTVGGETAKKAAILTDAWNRSRRVVKDLVFELGSALAPTATSLADTLTNVARRVASWIKDNQKLVVTAVKVAAIVTGVGAAFLTVGLAATVVALSIGAVVAIIGALGTVVGVASAALAAILSPIGLVIAGVVGLGGAILYQTGIIDRAFNGAKSLFQDLAKVAKDTFGGVSDALKSGDIKLAGEIAMTGLELAWVKGTESIREIWGKLEDWILKSFNKIATAGKIGFSAAVAGAKLIVDKVTNEGQGAGKILGELGSSIGSAASDGANLDAGIDARRDGKKSDLQDRIERLTKELSELTDRAKDQVEESKKTRTQQQRLPDPFAGSGVRASSGRTASGVFQSSAVRSLIGQGDQTEKQIAQNTKMTADELRKLIDLMRAGTRAVFG